MSRMFALALIAASTLHLVEAQAQTWVQIPFQGTNFQSVACSADGTRVVVVEQFRRPTAPTNEGPVWLSTNSGASWQTVNLDPPSTNVWGPAAMSADGSTIFVGTGYTDTIPSHGPMFASYDGGITWTGLALPNVRWRAIACSADGSIVFAAGKNGFSTNLSYISHNGGVSWTSNSIAPNLNFAGCSANGSVLLGGSIYGTLQISTNTGASWQQANVSFGPYSGPCCSWDGRQIFAMPDGPYTSQISSDYGVSWVTITNLPEFYPWYSVACSADGTKVVAAGATGTSGQRAVVFTSQDCGKSWTSNNIPYTAKGVSVACSADGNVMFLAAQQGIWTFQTNALSTLAASQSNASAVLSWPISSHSTTLQHAVDVSQPVWDSIDTTRTTNLSTLHISTTVPITNAQDFFRLSSP
jgi:hypothetical protein